VAEQRRKHRQKPPPPPMLQPFRGEYKCSSASLGWRPAKQAINTIGEPATYCSRQEDEQSHTQGKKPQVLETKPKLQVACSHPTPEELLLHRRPRSWLSEAIQLGLTEELNCCRSKAGGVEKPQRPEGKMAKMSDMMERMMDQLPAI